MNNYENFDIKTGDIFLTRFTPAYKSELRKYRPAVVLKTQKRINNSEVAIILPLSTAPDANTRRHEVKILKKDVEFLDRDSYVLCWYIRTVDTMRLIRKLGSLSTKAINRIKKKTTDFLNN